MTIQGQHEHTSSLPQATSVQMVVRPSTLLKSFVVAMYRWSMDNTFTPRWCPLRWPNPATCYGAIVLMQLVIIGTFACITRNLHVFHFLGLFNIFLTTLVALNWGAGPVLLASCIALPLQKMFLLSTVIAADLPLDTTELVSCVLVGLTISIGISSLKVQHRRTERRLQLEQKHLLMQQTALEASVLALVDTNQRMEEFVAIVSHEMRTPLAASIGNMQVAEMRFDLLTTTQNPDMIEQEDEISAIRDHLERAQRQVWQMNRLVDELLDLSLIQADKLILRTHHQDLTVIVQKAVEELRLTFPERTLQLACSTSLPVMADKDRITQVVTNYLTNALKYSATDQPVLINLDLQDQHACLSVHDHGPGIPQHELLRIWERFYRIQGQETLTGTPGGLGVGLYICRTIIEQHEGQVGVESEPHRGTRFWFTLPLLHA